MASLLQSRTTALTSLSFPTGNRLLGRLPPGEQARIMPHLKDVHLERGRMLAETGEPVAHVYFPSSGMISLLAVLPDGEAVETLTIGREGGLGLLAGLGSSMAVSRAVVQLPGQAGQMPAARWAELVAESAALRDLVVRYNDVQLLQIQQAVACNALHDVESRLCRWLLEARDRAASDALPLTQEFLGEMLGVRRTTVTIVARMLQAAGLVHYRRGVIHIRDAAGLEGAACECYQVNRRAMARLARPASAPAP